MPHIHEKIDFTVEVFIVHKNKVLLRMHDKFKEWLSVGGHIELDEDPNEAALREVKEEVGLDIRLAGPAPVARNNKYNYRELIPPRHMGRHSHLDKGHEHITLVYFATSETDEVRDSHHDHEKAETRWLSREEVEQMELLPDIKLYALEAIKELGQ